MVNSANGAQRFGHAKNPTGYKQITTIFGWGKTLHAMAWPVGADDEGDSMVSKFLLALVVGFGATSLLLYTMNKHLAEEKASLEQALATQAALLQETQAELKLRDDVIKQRDAEIAEAERKAEAQETKYARLVRTKKAVQDWDAVCLPDDVIGMLKGSSNSAAGAAGNTNSGSGHP